MTGSAGQKRVPAGFFRDLEIPLPPLPEQRRIAAILDHADALRAKRRQVLTHFDALTQSIFHAMFGEEPQAVRTLGHVADFFGGSSLPTGDAFVGQPAGALLMKVSDMNAPGNEVEIMATSLWTCAMGQQSSTVDKGAVVIPKRGASIATNKKRLTTRRTLLDPNLMGIQPKPTAVISRYLYEWFKGFDLSKITSGSTIPQLNKQDLAPIQIPVPGLPLQRHFETQVEAIDEHERLVRRGLAADDELFASLQSRAFAGRL